MKHILSKVFVTSFLALSLATHAQLPVLNGTVGNVQSINTEHLLAAMNHGSSDLVLVAAHRGFWISSPENSTPALEAAFGSGIEIIELDLRTTSDGILVVSHDADLIKETTGTGFVSSTPWSTIEKLKLRDRKGNPTAYPMLRFKDALNLLEGYQEQGKNGQLYGPVIIADLKDKNAWAAYTKGVADMVAILPPLSYPSVVFKMKMKNLPDIATVQAAASAHPNYGHILPVVNPEDASGNANGFDGPDWDPSVGAGNWSPSSSNFQALKTMSINSPHFVQQFELNINFPGDGASGYVAYLNSFATYYQPTFYPEGVSTISTSGNTYCCYSADLNADWRGILPFSTFYSSYATPGVSLITSDNLGETLNYLVSLNKRKISELQD